MIPADKWPDWADRHCWDENGQGWFAGAVAGASAGWYHNAKCSGIPLPPGHDWRVPVMRSQPAPAIDLEQFRKAVRWARIHAITAEFSEECDRLLALIDGQECRHPAGTPMMQAGRFYDGCWKLAPAETQHHGGMLTQLWQVADSSVMKRALEAGVLALIDGQAAPRPLIARQLAEWHDDDGPVMWWAWCGHGWAGEPGWCGTPNDSDWPGHHTHWTPHPPVPVQPTKGEGE